MNQLPHSRKKNTIFPCKGLYMNGPLLVIFSTLPRPIMRTQKLLPVEVDLKAILKPVDGGAE